MSTTKVKLVTIISVPMTKKIVIITNQSIGNAENYFVSLRDHEQNHDKKEEYDRARLLLKWAACCNGSLMEMKNEEHNLEISLGFDSRDDLIAFLDSLELNVKMQFNR